MRKYNGLQGDTLRGGGTWVKDHKTGGEIYNFQPFKGYCYGYGRVANSTVALERLGAASGVEFLDDVLVIWVAASCVVGWYEHARLYREAQQSPSSNRIDPPVDGAFCARAKFEHCTLIGPEARKCHVPRATKIKGGMGRYVWYAEGSDFLTFRRKLLRYIASGGSVGTPPSKRGVGRQIDTAKRKQVEDSAIDLVWAYFEKYGFTINDVQDKHLGWDLEATRGEEKLLIEVKGTSARAAQAELSANEYAHMKMRKHRMHYRVCIVSDALSENPILGIFSRNPETRFWEHHENGSALRIESKKVEIAKIFG